MGVRWRLNTDHEVASFNDWLAQGRLAGKNICVEVVQAGRSIPQNSMIRALYREVAEQIDDQDVLDIERECKLVVGVGIVKQQSEKFAEMYDKCFKWLSYEEKIEAMDFMPVTRLMDTKHCSEYIDAVVRRYSQRGLSIMHPGEKDYA